MSSSESSEAYSRSTIAFASARRLARSRMVEGRCVGTFFLRGVDGGWITHLRNRFQFPSRTPLRRGSWAVCLDSAGMDRRLARRNLRTGLITAVIGLLMFALTFVAALLYVQ